MLTIALCLQCRGVCFTKSDELHRNLTHGRDEVDKKASTYEVMATRMPRVIPYPRSQLDYAYGVEVPALPKVLTPSSL